MRSVDRERCYCFYQCCRRIFHLIHCHSQFHILPNSTSKNNNNVHEPLSCVAKWLLENFQRMFSTIMTPGPSPFPPVSLPSGGLVYAVSSKQPRRCVCISLTLRIDWIWGWWAPHSFQCLKEPNSSTYWKPR